MLEKIEDQGAGSSVDWGIKIHLRPPCGPLEPKEMDSIRSLQCRPRLGPQHRSEEV
jgi:hypothetical protein